MLRLIEGNWMARGWSYWSRNKLEILTDYLPAFNSASKGRASERIYIDVMAGEPENHDRETGEAFNGVGPGKDRDGGGPGFTRFAFGEMPPKAAQLEVDLEPRSAGRPFKVYEGDCNTTIKGMLADLSTLAGRPPSHSSTSRRRSFTPEKRWRPSLVSDGVGRRPSSGSSGPRQRC